MCVCACVVMCVRCEMRFVPRPCVLLADFLLIGKRCGDLAVQLVTENSRTHVSLAVLLSVKLTEIPLCHRRKGRRH